VAVSRPKPSDATGVARQKAIKKNAEELKRREQEMTTIAAAEAKRMETEVFDPKSDETVEIVDEVIALGTEFADETVIVRTVADIESMTWGYGNVYNFTAGAKYKVPKDLAEHLESLGYLYTA
jgi:hypothetical protein